MAALETVIVSTQDILPNEPLDPLLGQGAFKQIRVPREALVSGAVTDTQRARGGDLDLHDLRERADPGLAPVDR